MNTKSQVSLSYTLGFFSSLVVGALAGYGFGKLIGTENAEVYSLFTGALGVLVYLHTNGKRTHEVMTEIESRRRK